MSDDKNVVPIRRTKKQKVTREDAIQKVIDAGAKNLVIVGETDDGVLVFNTSLTNAEMVFLLEYAKTAVLMGED